MVYMMGSFPGVGICRVVVACPWSVVSSRYSCFFRHVKPQNSNIRAFKNVGRNKLFLSSPHLCFIIVFICDLFVSRDDPLMS